MLQRDLFARTFARRYRKDRVSIHKKELEDLQNDIEKLKNDQLNEETKKELEILQRLAIDYSQNVKYAEMMPVVKSTKIPAHIPLKYIWNDCYYDKKRKVFVTFRKFRDGLGPKMLANQKELNPDCEGVVIPQGEMTFCYGYPAVWGRQKMVIIAPASSAHYRRK